MAVSLASAAVDLQDHRAKAVLKPIQEQSPILDYIKVVDTGGDLTHMYNQDQSLPTVSYVGLNANVPTPSQGTQRRVMQTVARMVIPLRIDSVLRNAPALWEREEVKQTRLAGIAAGLQFSADFFRGNPDTDPLKPKGLYKYLDEGIANGTLPSQQLIDGGGVGLTLELLDQLLDGTVGENRVLFMNRRMKRKILSLARSSSNHGMLEIEGNVNDFGKKFETYDGVPIRVIERIDDYSSTLDYVENGVGILTSGSTASIWCVSFGDEMGCYAFAPAGLGMKVEPFEKVPGQLYYDSVTQWLFNYVVAGPRSVTRLSNLTNA